MFKLNSPTSLPEQEGFKNVRILSDSIHLSTPQLALLDRGLTFIPSCGIQAKEMTQQSRFDLQYYHRRLKLADIYDFEEVTAKPPFTPASNWTPPDAQLSAETLELIRKDQTYFQTHFKFYHAKPNLTKDEYLALKELRQNKEIIIKPADKGSAVVVMEREHYLWEGYRQLNDKNYYTKLQSPIYQATIPIVHKIISRLHEKKFINSKQKQYLIGDSEIRPRRFYLLPKIHKPPISWSRPFIIPSGRPIVSDCSSETYKIAEYLDFFLNPLSITHSSYLKDTYDFIDKVKNIHVPADSILFTIDIDSLYTNIDTREGIQSVKDIFSKNYNKRRPDKELLELLEISLTRNDFEFNGEYFLQIKGTAMGKKFAPAYANIFMANWETQALSVCEKRPMHYYRYLDDIWGIWTHSEEDFQLFLNTLNNFNSSIKIKHTLSHDSIDFLDTTTFKGPKFSETNRLDIKVFFKETDTHALLHKTSYHPRHTFAGLIKSQLLRFHRICTQYSDFKKATRVLFSALTRRGYSRTFLRTCHKQFLQIRPINVSPIIPFVTTYSAPNVKLVRGIRNNFEIFMKGRGPLHDCRLIAAFRRNKNLKDHLVKAQIKPLQTPKDKHMNDFFKQLRWVSNRHNKNIFKINNQGNIKSKNCIYIIICKQCGIQYVGETRNTIGTRFTQHRYNILRKKDAHTQLVKHFIQHDWSAVQASVLESNPNWNLAQRQRAERAWISRLNTRFPQGLNEQ